MQTVPINIYLQIQKQSRFEQRNKKARFTKTDFLAVSLTVRIYIRKNLNLPASENVASTSVMIGRFQSLCSS